MVERLRQIELEPLQAGMVAIYQDGDGTTHKALILEAGERETFALFVTSHPGWNPFARRATKEELALLGVIERRPTYLAPVLRTSNCFDPTSKPTFSIDRVMGYLREFPREKAIPDGTDVG